MHTYAHIYIYIRKMYFKNRHGVHFETRDTVQLKQDFKKGDIFDNQLKMDILEFVTTICHL